MSNNLRDELASLRIERKPIRGVAATPGPRRPSRGGGGGGRWFLRLLALTLWLIPVALLTGAAAYAYRQYDRVRPALEVQTVTLQPQTAADAVKLLEAKGYLKARYKASVGTKTPGRIKDLYVEEGSVVEAGQLLAELEHNEIDALIQTREASRDRAKAELAEEQADLIAKDRRASRLNRLFSQNNASFEEVDLAVAERDKCKARVVGTEAQVKVLDAQIAEVNESLKNMLIYAPFAGTVLTKSAEKGETINMMSLGSGGGRSALIELADLKSLEVDTDVAERELARVSKGQLALVEVPAAPGRSFRAHVRQIIQMGDRAKGEVKIYVALDENDPRLFPELFARVKFLPSDVGEGDLAGLSERRLYLDPAAMVQDGDATFVWILADNNTVSRREVTVNRSGGKLLVEEGLSSGDRVIVNPPAELQDGLNVRQKAQ